MTRTERTTVDELQIGDVISCEYIATANTVGFFQNLGRATKPVIPPTSSNAPNGSFYWIMTGYDHLGRKKLVADRNIQHSISWNALDAAGVIAGAKRLFGNENVALGKTVLGDFPNTNYSRENAVDGNPTTQALLPLSGADQNSTTARRRSVTIDLIEQKQINTIILTSALGLSSFDVEISNDNINFTTIYSGTMELNSKKSFILPDHEASRYFSVSNIKTNYFQGNASLGVSEIELYEGVSYSVTIPTGGISASDKDNDWDKIIAESTLSNTVTSGNNATWNWSGVSSWTSTASGSNKVIRGSSAVSTWTESAPSSTTTNLGFRPILLVDSFNPQLLLKSINDYYTFDEVTGWTQLGAWDDSFINNAIYLSTLNANLDTLPRLANLSITVLDADVAKCIQTVEENAYTTIGTISKGNITETELEKVKSLRVE